MVRGIAVALLAAAGALLAACGGTDYRYLSNREAGAFFKVPDDWRVYDEGDLLRASDAEATREELEEASEGQWYRGFDGSEDPEPTNLDDLHASSPRGSVAVRDLTSQERDAISLGLLRRAGSPVPDPETGQPLDPLRYWLENREGFVQMLDYEDGRSLGQLSLAEGQRGVRLRYRVDVPEQGPALLEQVVAVDEDSRRLYRFTVGCSEDCWDDNEDVIREIADSWTLEEAP